MGGRAGGLRDTEIDHKVTPILDTNLGAMGGIGVKTGITGLTATITGGCGTIDGGGGAGFGGIIGGI